MRFPYGDEKVDKFIGSLVMVLLFVLRCVIPLVLTMLIGRAMNRLVDKWEAEEAARPKEPGSVIPAAVPMLLQQPDKTAVVRCWVFRDCGRTDCTAYQNPDSLCWKIKTEESGQLPDKCQQCAYYDMTMARITGSVTA